MSFWQFGVRFVLVGAFAPAVRKPNDFPEPAASVHKV